jgi:hypothetical protein
MNLRRFATIFGVVAAVCLFLALGALLYSVRNTEMREIDKLKDVREKVGALYQAGWLLSAA